MLNENVRHLSLGPKCSQCDCTLDGHEILVLQHKDTGDIIAQFCDEICRDRWIYREAAQDILRDIQFFLDDNLFTEDQFMDELGLSVTVHHKGWDKKVKIQIRAVCR